jgi:hypothetical protein
MRELVSYTIYADYDPEKIDDDDVFIHLDDEVRRVVGLVCEAWDAQLILRENYK